MASRLGDAAEGKALQQLSAADFKRGWYSVGFLYPGLHPDSALEHGKELCNDAEDFPEVRKVEPRLLAPYYVDSGWPRRPRVAPVNFLPSPLDCVASRSTLRASIWDGANDVFFASCAPCRALRPQNTRQFHPSQPRSWNRCARLDTNFQQPWPTLPITAFSTIHGTSPFIFTGPGKILQSPWRMTATGWTSAHW